MKALLMTGLLIAISSSAVAEQYIFPAEGQSHEQQEQDEYTCHKWAVDETGFNPMNASTSTSSEYTSAPTNTSATPGSGMRGAVAGGVAGAVIADIGDNDTDHGAQRGAAIGLVSARRHSRRSNEQAAQQQQAQQQQTQSYSDAEEDNYFNANEACLEAKGYSVK
jgi:hypothetical protein